MRRSTSALRLCAGAMAVVLAGGCATVSGWSWPWSEESGGEEPEARLSAGDLLDAGVEALETGKYGEAETHLRWLASRCETGREGRTAVLLLAVAALDPRNPDGSSDRGAQLSAHFLGLTGPDPTERAVARTLYLLALDGGGRAVEAAAPDGAPAPRFHDCDAADTAVVAGDPAVSLPELPRTPSARRLNRTRAQRDSLRARVTELEAELGRIRELLRQGVAPDTFDLRPR